MSPNPANAYAAINARTRGMYSTLLTQQDLLVLSEAKDFDALIGFLKNTAYGPYFERLKDKELTPRRAAYLANSRLSEAFHSIISNVPEHARELITQMYRYHEVSNLKGVLRGIVTGSTWDKVRFVLFPLGCECVLPAQEMLESGNVAQAVELLRGTQYYDVLSYAVKRYNAEQNLFPIEVALDLAYWRVLWKTVDALPKGDRPYAARVIGTLLDTNNLMWAIRYRAYHNLSEEEIINYTLPFGYHVKDEDIRAIAAGAEIAPIVKKLFPSLHGVDEMLSNMHSGLPKLEVQLERMVAAQCHSCFMGDPFQIGIPVGFLQLFSFEIQELIVLFEAKSRKQKGEEFKEFLLMEV